MPPPPPTTTTTRPRCRRKRWTLFGPHQAVCLRPCCDVPWINAQVRFAGALGGALVRDDVGDLRRVGGDGGGVVEWRLY
jgi:hypothetical protein